MKTMPEVQNGRGGMTPTKNDSKTESVVILKANSKQTHKRKREVKASNGPKLWDEDGTSNQVN